MYFENIYLNFILVIGFILIFTLLNFYLNHHARFLMKYTSSLKQTSKELVENFSKNENIELFSYASRANNDLDNYIGKSKSIFINAKHYFSSSLYTLARTIYFCAMSKVERNNYKLYKFQNKVDSIFSLLEVLAWGLLLIGLIIKNNLLIIIGLGILLLSIVFVFINYRIIKLYQDIAKEYLSKILKDKNEVKVISLIYQFELYQYLLKPFLSLVKLFPFLLSSNQKKLGYKDDYYGK